MNQIKQILLYVSVLREILHGAAIAMVIVLSLISASIRLKLVNIIHMGDLIHL